MSVQNSVPADLQFVTGPSWRARALWLLALAVVTGGVVFVTYATFFSGGEDVARDFETHVVGRMTIRSTIAASGIAVAQQTSDASFDHPGRVKTIDVELGDKVTAGQVLATLDEPDIENAVLAAESQVRTAEIKLRQLLKGASEAELAAAEQSVASAQATFDKASRDLQTLLEGASVADIASAEQAVANARANLADAEARLEKLEAGADQSAIAQAEAAVIQAQAALDDALADVENADADVASATGDFQEARGEYCAWDDAIASICPVSGIYPPPLSDADVDDLQDQINNTSVEDDLDFLLDQSALLTANASYNTAVQNRDSVGDDINQLEKNLESAESKLDELQAGASDEEIDAAEAAVTAAEQALDAAQAKLDDLRAGADAADIMAAESQAEAARMGVFSAQAKLDDLLAGADEEDVDLARENVESARIQLLKAHLARDKTRLVAPFDGVIAGINVNEGEMASSAQAAFNLLTPDALRLDLTIGEVDLPNVKAGQPGGIIFDAIQGRPYIFIITSVGLAPQVQQGVVTYVARANLMVPDDAPKPAPGMNGAALVQLEARNNAVAIPTRAIRKRGDQQIVDVQLADGAIEERVVETGLSDGTNVEITSGVSEGETILIPSLTSGGRGSQQNQVPGGIR